MNEFIPHGVTHLEKVIFRDYQDPLVSLLQSAMKLVFFIYKLA